MALSQTIDRPITGSITTANANQTTAATANSAVVIAVDPSCSTIGIHIGTSAWTGGAANTAKSLLAQVSINGTNWVTLDLFVRVKQGSILGNTWISNIPSGETNGIYVVQNNGYKYFRLSSSNNAVTGTAAVTLINSIAPFPSNVQYTLYSAEANTGLSSILNTSNFITFRGNAIKDIKIIGVYPGGNMTGAASNAQLANITYGRATAVTAFGTLGSTGNGIQKVDPTNPATTVLLNTLASGFATVTTNSTVTGGVGFLVTTIYTPVGTVASGNNMSVIFNDGLDRNNIWIKGTGDVFTISSANLTNTTSLANRWEVVWAEV
jgi:hypothetical protein